MHFSKIGRSKNLRYITYLASERMLGACLRNPWKSDAAWGRRTRVLRAFRSATPLIRNGIITR